MLFFSVTVYCDNHYIDDCLKPGSSPELLYNQEISKDGQFLQYQREIVRIPTTGFSDAPITCLTVINLDNESVAGYPHVKAGGVGFNYVTLELESQLSRGYDFQITVYYDSAEVITGNTILEELNED
ncbi:hypothetical protein ABEB36_008817 [Hypothenemus hampei]|uniref:Uncharacterized protein n=1 Tax=Hypothenemus hampei TaxID=57062 RepID=A0ABD1ENT9_HYPHA